MKKPTLLFTALIWLVGVSTSPADPPVSTSADFTVLPGHPGNSGGRVSGGTITAETVTGNLAAGGVSNVTSGGVEAKGGYTGQLYDPVSLTVTAAPSAAVDEGDSVKLSAGAIMDDDTLLEKIDVVWSVQSGPLAFIDSSGLAFAGAVTANTIAVVQGAFAGVAGLQDITINNLPYQPSPLTWEDPAPGGNGPYRVFFGTDPNALPLVGNPTDTFFNPGQLELGTTYYWRVLDASGNDLTPGGNGTDPVTFTTDLFKPDMRIGPKGNPVTHRGNDIYNLSGIGQIGKLKLQGKRKGKLHFSVENDGDTPDDHTIRGNRASKKFKFIKYFRLTGGRVNITAAAIRAGFTETDVGVGNAVLYQVQAKANGEKPARQTLKISAKSAKDTRAVDLAKGKLKGLVK